MNRREKPIIGITTGQMLPSGNLETAIVGLRRPYIEAVRNSDGIPIIVPFSQVTARQELVDLARSCDGWIFSGGGDFDPKCYGQEVTGAGEMRQEIDGSRDEFELGLLSVIYESQQIPVLGICRGMQGMNIQRGGDLVQRVARTDLHMPQTQSYDGLNSLKHSLNLQSGTRLAEIFGIDTGIEVNTGHHQAVGRLGARLRVSARSAEDDIVEALEHKTHPWIGVQWHPEMMYEEMKPLFDWLVESARDSREC